MINQVKYFIDVKLRKLMKKIFEETISDADLPEFTTKEWVNYRRLIEEIEATGKVIAAGSEIKDVITADRFPLVYPSDLILIRKKSPLDVISSRVKVRNNLF